MLTVYLSAGGWGGALFTGKLIDGIAPGTLVVLIGLRIIISSVECSSQVCRVLLSICLFKSVSTTRSLVITFTILFLHFLLHSSFPVGTRNIAIPSIFLAVEHPNMDQFAPGIVKKLSLYWHFSPTKY